jgi:hypothetical protein
MYRLLLPAAIAAILIVPAARAEESCQTSGPMLSKEAITKSLQDRGYAQVRSLSEHHGCYEAKGLDSKGKRFELEVNGATGAIVTAE